MEDRSPRVRVRDALGDARRPVTVIQLLGEHDYASRGLLSAALEPLNGHVVIDLTSCAFLDSALIGAILGKALALGKAGHRLELVIPPSAPLARTIKRLRVEMVMPVLEQPPLQAP
jgi:anti-anti-sigma regulatory factor